MADRSNVTHTEATDDLRAALARLTAAICGIEGRFDQMDVATLQRNERRVVEWAVALERTGWSRN